MPAWVTNMQCVVFETVLSLHQQSVCPSLLYNMGVCVSWEGKVSFERKESLSIEKLVYRKACIDRRLCVKKLM